MNKVTKIFCCIGAALFVSGVAQAAKPAGGSFMLRSSNGAQVKSVRGNPVPTGSVPCLTVAGKTTNGEFGMGDPNNSVVNLNIGAGNELLGIAADVTVEAFDPSYLSESGVTFSSSDLKSSAITFTPSGTDDPGTETLSTEGVVLFAKVPADPPLPQIIAGADGILRLEWNEGFDDESVDPDSQWGNSATPNVCAGLRLICTNQAACDITVPVSLQQFSVD